MGSTTKIRLNKFIAESGVASRRRADSYITQGKVTVNGKKVFELGTQVDPQVDRVMVDEKLIKQETEKVYVMFFKPKNVLTSMEDPEGRPTIADYIQDLPYRVFPVGRLDWDSEGLLLLTNDGDFANRVMHPKEEIPKTYHVKLNGHPTETEIAKLKRGVSIIGGKVAAQEVEKLRRNDSSEKSWFRIVISEGKNRQIRKMFEKIGYDVEKLQRIKIGELELRGIERGEYTLLGRKAVERIFYTQTERTKPVIKRKKSSKRYQEKTKSKNKNKFKFE